jgi:hypothetical protein
MKNRTTSTPSPDRSLVTIKLIAPLLLLLAAILVAQPGTSAAPPVSQSCVEDFALDSDPSMPGFASSIFVHSPSGNYRFLSGGLALFAGATDVVTFPGQTVTRAKVSYRAFGEGSIIFEGTGDTKTFILHPTPFATAEVLDTSMGDNSTPSNIRFVGQIVRITLIGFEVFFDDLEIDPCGAASPITVDVLVKPKANNPTRSGLIKAVILSSPGFDARTVDPTSVHFGAASMPFRYFLGDEDEDGDTDLIFFFFVQEVGISCGDTSIHLTGLTTGGQPVEGHGEITTPGC